METEIRYTPKFGRVLIKRELTTKTAGGILIPDSAAKRNAPCEGVILELGETAGFTDTFVDSEDGYIPKTIQTLAVGDRVLFGRHAGTWLDAKEGNEEGSLFMCADQDILAVIKGA